MVVQCKEDLNIIKTKARKVHETWPLLAHTQTWTGQIYQIDTNKPRSEVDSGRPVVPAAAGTRGKYLHAAALRWHHFH